MRLKILKFVSYLAVVAVFVFTPDKFSAQEIAAKDSAVPNQIQMEKAARDYLEEVFEYIRKNAVFRHRLDWEKLRRETFARAAAARTTADTYPAVEFLVSRLEDNNHSAFFPPEERAPGGSQTSSAAAEKPRKRGGAGVFAFYPSGVVFEVLAGSSADRSGLRVGDKILTVNNRPVGEYGRDAFALSFFGQIAEAGEPKTKDTEVVITFLRAGSGRERSLAIPFDSYSSERIPAGYRMKSNIGYLEVPMMLGQTREAMTKYAAKMQEVIKRIDAGKPGDAPVTGWIIDLRRNQGGNSWPMMAGLGPLLGDGPVGESVDVSNEKKDETRYENGEAKLNGEVVVKVAGFYRLRAGRKISVAVLTGPMTASSGEFAALWFKGSDRSRSFGEPTHGVPTVNIGHRFSDGSGMNLTVALGTDRRGRSYSGRISPDTEVAGDWTRFGTEKDPPVAAAVKWLRAGK